MKAYISEIKNIMEQIRSTVGGRSWGWASHTPPSDASQLQILTRLVQVRPKCIPGWCCKSGPWTTHTEQAGVDHLLLSIWLLGQVVGWQSEMAWTDKRVCCFQLCMVRAKPKNSDAFLALSLCGSQQLGVGRAQSCSHLPVFMDVHHVFMFSISLLSSREPEYKIQGYSLSVFFFNFD